MDVSSNQGSSESESTKAPSSSGSQQGPIGITPQTPHNEQVLNERIDGAPRESAAGSMANSYAASDALPSSSATHNDPSDARQSKENNLETMSSKVGAVDNKKNLSQNEGEFNLSSSAEHVNLEYSLGSLETDTSPRPTKRPRVEHQHHHQHTGSSTLESAADALAPQFWNDGASVNEDNVPSRSFDVADDDLVGGSSPFVSAQSSSEDSPAGKILQMGEAVEKSINEAEDVMNTAIMAADVLDEDEVETPKAGPSPSKASTPKPPTTDAKADEVDFGKLKSSDNNDQIDSKSDISSASSLVDSYQEDDESRPFPPAPPSTPATAKDMYQPLPFQPDTAAGSLEYSVELNKGSDHPTPPNISATPRGPPLMPEHSFEDDIATPMPNGRSYSAATAETPRDGDETPDISGDLTERRQGQEHKKGQIKLARKTDFEQWDVGDRYELKRILGRGSYGEVAQAVDRHAVALQERAMSQQQAQPNLPPHFRNSTYVAVKKISKPFDQEVDAVRLYREMHILRRLRGHNCIIQLVDVVQPRSSDLSLFNDLYLVFEYVDTDLYKLIMSPQYLTTEHIQTFLYQMLVGLKYIHSSSVIHRDLKPAILLNEDCTLKICDFGLARIVHNDKVKPASTTPAKRGSEVMLGITPETSSTIPQTPPTDMDRDQYRPVPRPGLSRQLTKHVVTRWYRAPELILIQPYASAVDIWSLGCIFAELLSMQEGSVPTYQDRQPLFPGGSCYPLSGDTGATGSDERVDQLSVIFSVIGMPSEEDLKSVGKANEYIMSLERKPSRSLESLYPAADRAAIDLLKAMLMFNPAKRCTAIEALEHEFLKPVRRKDMEKFAKEPLVSPSFLDKNRIDVSTLKEETYKEVLWYKQSRERYQH